MYRFDGIHFFGERQIICTVIALFIFYIIRQDGKESIYTMRLQEIVKDEFLYFGIGQSRKIAIICVWITIIAIIATFYFYSQASDLIKFISTHDISKLTSEQEELIYNNYTNLKERISFCVGVSIFGIIDAVIPLILDSMTFSKFNEEIKRMG